MSVRAYGFWGLSHYLFDRIGRGMACVVLGRTSPKDDGACTIAGASVACGIFGAALGFSLCDHSPTGNIAVATLLGGLLGACSGCIYGAIVEVLDDSIRDFLGSLTLK
jgi:hypothetical protein